ncbi:DUF969 family protein [Geobacillus stearothermophilus]|nr:MULTISPECIES: DUF969 family protein [Geobacillus]MED3734989.1 DUF969 family protein [Geobacillus stearothermophilus]MED3740342.1 DUF969 family protein [Geobacillus stearothermophilus]MED3749506.1 DUF969 family protein [Geobacillus stearothermophilus]MED3765381.1 DUF969 family protein [Geobacillus stearothermophilus]MED3769676.1 DUF969 family protein [Geobacillus stearothermophilus]
MGGHAQMVRPLVAPMAEGAADLRASADSVDSVGVQHRCNVCDYTHNL